MNETLRVKWTGPETAVFTLPALLIDGELIDAVGCEEQLLIDYSNPETLKIQNDLLELEEGDDYSAATIELNGERIKLTLALQQELCAQLIAFRTMAEFPGMFDGGFCYN